MVAAIKKTMDTATQKCCTQAIEYVKYQAQKFKYV
jgi:hypothetical protein